MPLLFSYGTLQQDTVQLSTFGRLVAGSPDQLVGFEQSLLTIEDPAFVAASGKRDHAIVKRNGKRGSRVRGTVLEVSESELASTDRYEPAGYTRITTTLASGKRAWVYVDARLSERARSGALEVRTRLQHFAIVTFVVDPGALRRHVHPRFDLDTIVDERGHTRALISVVPFHDVDFAFVRAPRPRWSFGQTNYRAYIRDAETGERAVWFFGTALDFFGVVVPRYVWRLPWHRATIAFDCDYDDQRTRYRLYRMRTESRWAPAHLALEDTGAAPAALDGFADLESGLVTLTHPLDGYYYRRDGRLGSYRVAHARLRPTVGRVIDARFPLLERLGLVNVGDTRSVHSVLVQRETEFTIHLPPSVIDAPPR